MIEYGMNDFLSGIPLNDEDDIYDDFGISDSFDPFINDPDFYDD